MLKQHSEGSVQLNIHWILPGACRTRECPPGTTWGECIPTADPGRSQCLWGWARGSAEITRCWSQPAQGRVGKTHKVQPGK